ncbi:MAG: ATP-grasp domain-containing protein [Gammaproteobacteria bacterium]
MRDQELRASLRFDGETMLQALMTDLRVLAGIDIISTRDDRLENLPESIAAIGINDNVRDIWTSCMQAADAVWVIAPESGGLLATMHKLALDSGCGFVGCNTSAMHIAASKSRTAEALSTCAIPCIETFLPGGQLPRSNTGWVVKPDDGAGSEDCYFFEKKQQLRKWWEENRTQQPFVVQRYVPGLAASVSALYDNGRALLLSCNEQLFQFEDGRGRNRGVVVNGLRQHRSVFEDIAIQVGKAIPGLWGYIGIDLILTKSGPVVVEINPRLTTSYAGLSKSLGLNVAELILQFFNGQGLFEFPRIKAGVTTVEMYAGND